MQVVAFISVLTLGFAMALALAFGALKLLFSALMPTRSRPAGDGPWSQETASYYSEAKKAA